MTDLALRPTATVERIAPLPHLPALDGLRGLAVLAVLAYHSEFAWMRGGFLGVSLFFTLSGFLIGSIVLREWELTGGLDLVAFWRRRFRRLLPASLLCVGFALALGQWAFGPQAAASVGGDALGALGYVANWRFLASGQSYGALFTTPSPLQHFWSLAIEEQFYVLFPLCAVGLLRAGRKWFVAGLCAVSFGSVALAVLSGSPDRVYYGTDTRASELALGVLLACWYVKRSGRTRRAPRWSPAIGLLALAVTVELWALTSQGDRWLTQGGFALVAVTSCCVIVGTLREGLISRWLGTQTLAFVGRISYGLYLFHWPVFLWLNDDRLGTSGAVGHLVRWGVTFAAAAASSRLVELPIRRGQVLSRRWWPAALSSVALVASCSVVSAATTAAWVDPFAPVDRAPLPAPPRKHRAAAPAVDSTTVPDSTAAPSDTAPVVTDGAAVVTAPADSTAPAAPAPQAQVTPPAPPAPVEPPRVLMLGDSTGFAASKGMLAWAEQSGDAVAYSLTAPGCSFARALEYRGSLSVPYRTRDSSCDWEAIWPTVIPQFEPDVIVMISSAMDVSEFKVGDGVRAVGSPDGDEYLLAEMNAVVARLHELAPGAKVVWATGPYNDWKWGCPDPCLTSDRGRIDAYNGLVYRLAEQHPEVAVLDYGSHLNAGKKTVDTKTRPDGVHLSDKASLADARKWLGPTLLDLFSRR